MRRISTIVVTLLVVFVAATQLCAEDAFFDVPLTDLKITSGELPKPIADDTRSYRFDSRWQRMYPYVVLDGAGEAYLEYITRDLFFAPRRGEAPDLGRLVVRAPAGKDITGHIALPTRNDRGMTLLTFTLPASAAKDTAATKFHESKLNYFRDLNRQEIPGAAWYRHQAREAEKQLERLGASQGNNRPTFTLPIDRSSAYDLFSGGRAISENLQLDRAIRETKSAEPTVPLDTLEGITIAEIDWKPLLKDAKPELDPLSKSIPADQHAVFFPSFEAATKLVDETQGREMVLMRLAEPRSEDAGTLARYQRQLGLSLSGLSRAVGGKLIGSVALTGSDPYFRTGTDVAVLFDCKNPTMLSKGLLMQIQKQTSGEPQIEAKAGEIEGVKYQGYETPDRTVSTYVAALDGAVAITNSLAQLKRLVAVAQGTPSLASLDEYKFFRSRYTLGDKDETAFLFLSDATIRRWCSPRWRIASARRTFTAAALSELTAAHVKELAAEKVETAKLLTDLPLVDAGNLKLSAGGVQSSTHGSLAWMTPIVEMDFDKVTKEEAEAYEAWRRGYQSNWQWAFDPIGFRIGLNDDRLLADLTVMPLIVRSDYREFMNLSRGAAIKPHGGDQHDALMQVVLAINKDSDAFRQSGLTMSSFMPGLGGPRVHPMSWLGESVSLYVDDDPFWKELAETPQEERQKFLQKSLHRLPVAVYADVSDSLRLTAFLAGLKGFVDSAAPGMATWETLEYREEPYVCVKPTRRSRDLIGDEVGDLGLYYAPSPEGITFTLNEALLKRAIDRRLERRNAKDGETKEDVAGTDSPGKSVKLQPWLGKNLNLQIDQKMFHVLSGTIFSSFIDSDAYEMAMQMRSWGNLPILNEWKRLFPDQDPVKVHERLWQTKLVCPGGGEYVWNDKWKTMESTVYGHPGEPKKGTDLPTALSNFRNANFGLTFEDQGLRGRMEIKREEAK